MADNINVTKVMDPRMRTDLDNEYIAVIGADNWVKYRFGASALSNTQMAFNNIKPAGEKFMINTRWYIEYKTRIILTADNAGAGETKLLNKGKFGLRPWPLQSCATNTLLRLSNKDFNTREQNWLHAVMQYISAHKSSTSSTPSCPTGSARHRSLLTPLALTSTHWLALGTSMMIQGMGW